MKAIKTRTLSLGKEDSPNTSDYEEANVVLKRCVLSLDLKAAILGAFLTSGGRLFHNCEPAKALSPFCFSLDQRT